MNNYIRLFHIGLMLCITLLFTKQSFGQYQGMLIQTFSETALFGSQVSGIGNVNGDDYDDIIVKGQDIAYIYCGGDPMDNIADVILNGVYSVSGAGDVNGDGYDDVIVGGNGIAYVYYGDDQMDNIADQTFDPSGSNYTFGSSVAGVGDVNNDSYDDIIIGDDGYTGWVNGNDIYEVGRAIIYFGGSPEMNNIPDVTMYGEIEYSNFGFSVSGAGDFNNDNYDDVIVGAPGYGQHQAGRAYIFYGGYSMDSSPDHIMEGVDYSKYGTSVSGAGDVNYDNYDDVIVGMPGYYSSTPPTDNGRVDIFYGAEDPGTLPYVISPNVRIIGDNYANLGRSLSGAGMVRRSLYFDVIIGESSYNSNTGRASIYFGDHPDIDDIADVIIEGQVLGEKFGISVSGAGDVNNDGMDEVIIGADGKAYVYSIEIVCEGSYVLTSQSDVDNFYPGCRIVTGSLTVQGSDITNLDGLSKLESIGGSLNFWANDNLINISGLSELTSIGGGLYIIQNPALMNIDGLSSLISVGGTVDIRDNDHLTSVSGLSKLTTIGSELQIDSNPELTSIAGLSSLTSVGVALRIKYNYKLISLEGLSGLTLVGDLLEIEGNSALTNIDALSGVESVGFNVLIIDNDELNNVGLSGLTSIGNNLVIENNNVLANIDGFSSLTSVGANLSIQDNISLLDISGFLSLNSVGGDLSIKYNNALKNITGLPGLTSVDGTFYIEDNDALTNLDGLAGLTSVGGSISILDNPELINLNGLYNLNSVALSLLISGNYALENLDGLSGLTSVGGELIIVKTGRLVNLNGLSNLISVGHSLVLRENGALENIEGLSALTSVGINIDIIDNPELINIDGLSNLKSVAGVIQINRNYALENLDGLSGLTSVGRDLAIKENGRLDNLNGLSNLISVYGTLFLSENIQLSNINGLSNLSSVGYLTIQSNVNLSNLKGLSGFTSTYGLRILGNSELTSIEDLSSLESVEGAVEIGGNDKLIDIGLKGLTSVGLYLSINSNNSLTNIDGLSSLMEVEFYLSLRNNPKLTRCCGLYPLLAFGTIGGWREIRYNGSGCTEDDIRLGGHCHSCDEDFVLTSQSEIDNFYTTGCAVLDGSLTIQGTNIANVDALTFLTSISGDLNIINNPLLTNLDGFINLTSLGGDLTIENDPILTDIDALSVSSLSSIGKNLKINNNITLTNLYGLSALTYVGGDILLTNNPLLIDFSGLYPVLNIGGVTGSITIEGNGTNPPATEILFVGLNERIEQFYSTGLLDEGQSTALIIRLEQATQKLNRGKTNTAINILNSCINQVNSFITEGILTEAEGQELISALNEIINQINAEKGLSKKCNKNITEEIQTVIPENYSLAQNYPNPFNPITTIVYGLPEDASVVLKIFNVLGAEVMQFTDGHKTAGYHKVSFDATRLPSGIYFYRLQAGSFVEIKKMVLMK